MDYARALRSSTERIAGSGYEIGQASKITSKLSELIAQLEEIKIENGISPRTVRQWKKETKAKYAGLSSQKERLTDFLESIERRTLEETESRKWEAKQQLEEAAINERHERERKLWEQKLQAELEITKKRMELERKQSLLMQNYQNSK